MIRLSKYRTVYITWKVTDATGYSPSCPSSSGELQGPKSCSEYLELRLHFNHFMLDNNWITIIDYPQMVLFILFQVGEVVFCILGAMDCLQRQVTDC